MNIFLQEEKLIKRRCQSWSTGQSLDVLCTVQVGIGRFDWNCASCSAVVFTKKQNDEDEDDDEVQERKR